MLAAMIPRHAINFRRAIYAARDPSLQEIIMLYWAIVFFVIAIVAAVFGFGGIAAGAASIAKLIFLVFVVLFVLSLIFGGIRGRGPRP